MKKLIEKVEWLIHLGGTRRDIIFLVISGIALIFSIFEPVKLPFNTAWIAIVLCGVPIILEAIIGLVTEFDIKADVLVSLALIASVATGENFAAGEVAFIIQIGGLLEELTVAKARAGIEKLVHLTPQTARILREGKEFVVRAEEVIVGDVLRILPGETIPVDGVVLSGQTAVNQAVMTGESMPVDKIPGDEVSSGTVNQYGAFEMKAVKVGEDSSIQRMIQLVQTADAGKAKIVSIADRWATWIVVIALTAAALTWLVTGELIRSVTILVVFCPCALVLATPTAIMAAIGNATKHGFLVRQGDALERLAEITTITFDKTGTLTYGAPKVIAIQSCCQEYTEEQIYQMAASAEQLSEHPLGRAILKSYKQKMGQNTENLSTVEEFSMIPGRGVSARIDGHHVLAGNEKMMAENRITENERHQNEREQYLEKGCTVIMLSIDQIMCGYLVLSDTIRAESKGMIAALRQLGTEPVLLTGDHKNAARTIGDELGITDVKADCLPEDKLKTIAELQKKGQKVCMIGDGVNDAPALKKSDVGIAMGGIGSDIAVDAADIALVDDEVKELPHLIALSKRMMATIKLNLTFSMGLNFLAIILAITGVLNPVVGALVHNCGSVLVIVNSAVLLRWHRKER